MMPPARRLLRLASLLVLSASRSAASETGPELHWPTDGGRCVTSGFCEFRPGHFHSGIDISTGGRVGLRCFAADSGSIVRARVSCHGYGRALYLRLHDGRTVTYAHLSAFAGAVADTILVRQLAQGSAYLDLEFPASAFPVGRGDLIAWTGQSGVGVPHLHVEVRDKLERPMDPLSYGLAVPDGAAPSVKRVAITPLTPRSAVDGGSDPVVLAMESAGQPGMTRAPRAVPVEGAIGLSVEVDEATDACRFRLAPRRLELREGEHVLYAVEYDRFAFSETRLQDLQIDPRYSYPQQGDFHLLWRRPGNTLPFRQRVESDGILSGTEGGHGDEPAGESRRALVIVVTDAAGNRGEAQVDLSFAPPPQVRDLLIAEGPESVSVEAVAVPGRPLDEVTLERSSDLGATWTRLQTVEGEEPGRFEAQVPKDVALLVRARAVDVLGVVGTSRTIAVGDGEPPPQATPAFEVVTLGTWVEVRTAGGIDWRDHTLSPRPWGEGTRLVLDPRSLTSAPVRCEGLDPWGRVVQLTIDPPARIGSGEVLPGPRGLASYRFGSGVLPQEAFAIVREKPAPRGEPELRPVGPLFVLDTGGVPWVGEYELTLLPERADGFDAAHVGVFVRGSSSLSWVSSARGESGWTARTGTPFGVGLFEDRKAPEIGPPRVEQSEGRTRLLFLARDRGAGVDCDDVEVLVGGVPWVHELDDETGDVVAYPAVRPSSGATVAVDVRVVDRCGNVSRREASVVLP